MAPENRAEWQNFVNSADIQPLGRAFGYQQEIPFEGRGRIDRFFEDPRNLRGLLGEITQDPSGDPRGAAVRTKRALQSNPQFLRDVELLMSRSPRSTIAGLEDAYALRQLFGEVPNQYGSVNPDASTERRGVTLPSTGQRVRVTERGGLDTTNISTNELSPFERTRQTASSLRPSVLAEDLAVLGQPEVLAAANVSPDSPSEAARRLLYETISQDAPNTNTAISLDAQRNADDEALRRLVTRNDLGQIQIGGEFPGQFAYDLNELLSTRGSDPDYILEYLQNSGELPEEASYPEPEEFDYDSDEMESRRVSGLPKSELDQLVKKYPELEAIKTGPSASGSRLRKEALLDSYGRYIPVDYKKLPIEELNQVINTLNASGNPDVQEYVYKTLAAGYVDKAEPVSNLNKMLEYSKNIANAEERNRVTNYLKDYLKEVDDKFISVSPRAAGIGGGQYLDPAEVGSLYPKAYEKLETLGSTAYVPDYFEPVISETFYSGSRPYKVQIERDVTPLPLSTEVNENFARLIEEKPFAGVYDIGFKVNGGYDASQNLPEDVKADIQKFVRDNALRDIPAGALIKNTPLGNEVFRKGSSMVNKRALAYQQTGFGARTQEGQFSYIDPETGDLVPVQPFRGRRDLRGAEGARAYYALDPVGVTASALKQNPYGAAGGAALTLLNDEVAKAIEKDDYRAAGVAAAKDVLGGAAIEAGLKAGSPALQRVAPGVAARVIPAVTGAAQYGIPAAVGAGLFSQGRSGSALNTLVNKAAPVVPGLKPNPQTDIGRRAGQAISNEARYLLNSVLQNRVPYLKGRLF